jgi:hypothetical protein
VIKTPDVVNLDKSHVSFCGKAFRFRQEIERSLHETKSEISWNREAWVHETKSEFVEGRGERCTKSSRNSSGKGESGRTKPSRNSAKAGERRCTKSCRNSAKAREGRCTKPSRNSAKAGERCCTKSNRISPERSPLIGAGEGEAFFSRCGVKPFAQKMTIYLKLRSLRWSVRSIACLTWCTNFQCCARARRGGKRDRAVCRQMYIQCVRGFWRADRLTGLREQRIHL